MPMMWYGYYGWVWIVVQIILWVVVIFGIVRLAQYLTRGRRAVGETPLDILKRRYASGEITKDQFEEMRKDIT
jgi:putative membrane protein